MLTFCGRSGEFSREKNFRSFKQKLPAGNLKTVRVYIMNVLFVSQCNWHNECLSVVFTINRMAVNKS